MMLLCVKWGTSPLIYIGEDGHKGVGCGLHIGSWYCVEFRVFSLFFIFLMFPPFFNFILHFRGIYSCFGFFSFWGGNMPHSPILWKGKYLEMIIICQIGSLTLGFLGNWRFNVGKLMSDMMWLWDEDEHGLQLLVLTKIVSFNK